MATAPAAPSYAGYRCPAEIIGYAVHGVTVSHETVRQWALKFGQAFAN